jgi:hypothetical protein
MNHRYLTLAGRIRQELQELTRVVERTQTIWQAATGSPDDFHVDATALNLHGFYAGLERLFELIADTVDEAKPGGANWHQELLRQMSAAVPGVRPSVLSIGVGNRLAPYRGFRYVVRNVYTFYLDPVQLGILVQELPAVAAATTNELLAFTDLLEAIAQDDPESGG